MEFKHIVIQNFCNLKNYSADLHFKTLISGKNKEGKSTIRNAILWVLTDKLADNSAAGDSIRPHDENGKRIDEIEISVSLTVDIDGSEYVLTKTQKQKWVKKRGCEDREFQGNENEFAISGVPKKSKDFTQFINDNICPADDLNFCMNANAFLSLDAKKRRAKVLGMAKSFTDDDVINANPQFEELRADLKVGTIEELTKREKATISSLKKNAAEIPARIDELHGQIAEYDFSALELEKNSLNEELAKIEKAEQENDAVRDKIMQAKFDLSSIEQNLNAAVKDKRHAIDLEIAEIKNELRSVMDDDVRIRNEKENAEQLISNNDKAIEEAENKMAVISERVFDESSAICKYCGQPLPEDKKEERRKEFEKQNADELNRVSDYLDALNNGKSSSVKKIEACDGKIAEAIERKKELSQKIQEKENEAAGLVLADVTEDSAYKAKIDEITALEGQLVNSTFDVEKAEIKAKIAEVERKLGQAEANNRIEDRIEQLKTELKLVGENTLKHERILHLLEEYSIAKIAMLEDSVNAYFKIIKWRFFEKQINGGFQEVCKAVVNGTDYDGLLNKSDRILCQMDLVTGFQDAAGKKLPVMLDDTESIDSDRITDSPDRQLIIFERADNELMVEDW